jgi:hypothetical protein
MSDLKLSRKAESFQTEAARQILSLAEDPSTGLRTFQVPGLKPGTKDVVNVYVNPLHEGELSVRLEDHFGTKPWSFRSRVVELQTGLKAIKFVNSTKLEDGVTTHPSLLGPELLRASLEYHRAVTGEHITTFIQERVPARLWNAQGRRQR